MAFAESEMRFSVLVGCRRGPAQGEVDQRLGQLVADGFSRKQQPAVDRRDEHLEQQAGVGVRADVLLLAGADDHCVPLSQLTRQAGNLTNARSGITRLFTAAEQASNHCQLGNIAAVSRLIDTWLEGSLVDGDAAARTPATMRS